jgi:hypothetical protein
MELTVPRYVAGTVIADGDVLIAPNATEFAGLLPE